ncbi:MAG: PfkB family carbohydrate kinase [Fibrobacteres bacterium]|nr:PfkB family carbohydrate kinase [Fibrobacterota bacterium]
MNNGQGPWVAGVGAALVDLLVEETDQFVSGMGSDKGGMTLVELETIDSALKTTKSPLKVVPGGSACNTIVGIGNLGGKARFIGRLGKDDLGKAFMDGLVKANVDHRLGQSDNPTGRVLSVVTPDTQRTMFTYLGASSQLSPEDVTIDDFADVGMVHLEGYLLFNRPVVEKIIAVAKQAKAKIVLDLGSYQVVEVCRDFLEQIIKSVDIVLANEDEAKAYTGMGESESLDILAGKVETAVVKIGKKGALLAQGKNRFQVDAHLVKALDTTGAGDLWASGFLFGLTQGLGIENSARLGCKVGSEVVQVMGAVIPDAGWKRVHQYRADLAASAR